MNGSRARLYLPVLTLLVLLLVGCADPAQPSRASDDERAAADAGAPSSRVKDPSSAGRSVDPQPGSTSAESDSSDGAPESPGGRKRTTGGEGAGSQVAGAINRVVDPEGDVEGDPTPAYTDIVTASIQSQGRRVGLQLEFAEDLPDKLPENEGMLAGIGILEDDDNPQYAFFVKGSSAGWVAFSQVDGVQSPFEGRLVIEGSTVSFEPSWAALGGPRSFEWGVSARWLGGSPGAREQGDDRAPETPQTYRL